MQKLQQNIGGVLRVYITLDDGDTPATGLVTGDFLVKQLAKASAAMGAFTLTIAERGYGHYDITMDGVTDCSAAGRASIHLEAPGVADVDVIFDVVAVLDDDLYASIGILADMINAVADQITVLSDDYIEPLYTGIIVRENTCQNVPGGSDMYAFRLDAGASATNQIYVGLSMRIISGTGAGQIREIVSYTGAAKDGAVSKQWAVQPTATSVYKLIGATAGPATALETLANSLPSSDEIAIAVWLASASDNTEGGTMGEALRNALGLAQNNFVIDETTFVGSDMTACRIRLFGSSVDAAAATPGAAAGDDDEVALYEVEAVFESSGKLGSYRSVKL